jgi:DNA-binding MarR family transcriptional regulator
MAATSCNQIICICIYLCMSHSLLPELPCMCGTFRRTSRALTQLYDQALRPLGLRATQLTILQVLSRVGEVSQGQLGEMLAMDSTTLTRTLEIMSRQGWIAERRGKDRRERWLRLAKAGETKLNRAMHVWEKVQSRLRKQLGAEAWKNLLQFTNQVTNLVTNLSTQGDLQ